LPDPLRLRFENPDKKIWYIFREALKIPGKIPAGKSVLLLVCSTGVMQDWYWSPVLYEGSHLEPGLGFVSQQEYRISPKWEFPLRLLSGDCNDIGID
jgi:hypothetical protein